MFDNLNEQIIQQFFQNGTVNSESDIRREEISLNFTVTSCDHKSEAIPSKIITSEAIKILKVATDQINKFDNWMNEFSIRNQHNLHSISSFLTTQEFIEPIQLPFQQLNNIKDELRKKNIFHQDENGYNECLKNRFPDINMQNCTQEIQHMQYQLNQVIEKSQLKLLREQILNKVQNNLLEQEISNLKNQIEKQKFQRSTLFTKTKHLQSQLKLELQKSKGLSAAKNSTSSSDIMMNRNPQSSLFIDPIEFDIQDWIQIFITKKQTYCSRYKRQVKEYQKKLDQHLQLIDKKNLKKQFRNESQIYQIYEIFRNIVMGLQLIKKMKIENDFECHQRSMFRQKVNCHQGQYKQIESIQTKRQLLKLTKIITGLTREKQYLEETLSSLRENIITEKSLKGRIQQILKQKEKSLQSLNFELNTIYKQNERLKNRYTDGLNQKQFIAIKGKLNGLEQIYMKVNAEKRQLEIYVKELQYKLSKEKNQRKNLHNQLEDIKGSIRVYCRVRPKLIHQLQIPNIIKTNGNRVMIDKKSDKLYRFDGVYDAKVNQEQIFEDINKLVQSAFHGHNISIIAYGQTGSGKTYTLHGDAENIGIAPRVINQLHHICEIQKSYYEISFEMVLVEIYNEKIIDLLRIGKQQQSIEIKEEEDGYIQLQNCTKIKINKPQQMQNNYYESMKNRKTKSIDPNNESSRSHLILTLIINLVHRKNHEKIHSKITIADLAGIQNIVSNDQKIIKESNYINKSLNSLSAIVTGISNKQEHLNYRDSKLTYLLKDSFNPNSKMIFFINLSPTQNNKEESINSLNFGSRIKNINQIYIPKKNDTPNDSKNDSREVSRKSTIKL